MRTLVLGALVAATLASGCRTSGAPPALEAQLAADARFVLSRGDGNEPLQGAAAVEAALPFALVLPRRVPLDAEITGVWVTTPPAGRGGAGQRRDTRVQLAYSNAHTRTRARAGRASSSCSRSRSPRSASGACATRRSASPTACAPRSCAAARASRPSSRSPGPPAASGSC